MRKSLLPIAALIAISLLLSACGAPPPLKSDKYLKDTTLIGNDASCQPPCFHGVTVGQTTFTDALAKVKADSAFSNVQSQDKPAQAAWAAAGGDGCCQMTTDEKTGMINAMLIKLAPNITVKQVIDKYGNPDYVTPVDYTPQEVALGLVFAKANLVTWVAPGDPNSTLKETDPVVVVLYLDPKELPKIIDTATLQGWGGYQSYQSYKSATPIVTPRVTVTPQPQ